MKAKISAMLAPLLMLVCGCKSSSLTCDYTERLGRKSRGALPENIVEVQIKIKKGLSESEPPGSTTTSFLVDCEIINGEMPKHPDVKTIRLRLYHDWTDIFLKDNTVLTLRFTQDGQLYDIKEFVVSGISP